MLPLGIGAAAIRHFALSAPGVDVALCGVYGSALDYFADDLVTPGGDVGLGVCIDEEKLARYAVR
jgi:hypothetical protein